MLSQIVASSNIAFGANGALLAIQIVLGLVVLGANGFMIYDAARRPDWAHQAGGSTKGLWIGLGIGGLVICWCCYGILSAIAPIVWFAAFRPKVIAAEEQGPSQGYGFGGPPPGYGPPGGYGGPPGGFGQPPGGYGGPPGGYDQPGGFPPSPGSGGGFPPPPPSGGFPPPPPGPGGPPPGQGYPPPPSGDTPPPRPPGGPL